RERLVCRTVRSHPASSWFKSTTPDPIPLLRPHYRALDAPTDRSAPVSCIGTLASRLAPLALLPWHQEPGSCSSTRKPVSDSRPLYAGPPPPRHQASGGLIPG